MSFQHLHRVAYTFGSHTVNIFVPDKEEVASWYRSHKLQGGSLPDPYWTQIWPAAIGLCEFLAGHIDLIRGKKILELAAGLGLPSLWAAKYVESGYCSDYLPEAVALMAQSAKENGIGNLEFGVLDWNQLPNDLDADVVLLSDINYEPTAFEVLFIAIEQFLKANVIVILSTPQRLVAKPFIERLLPLSKQRSDMELTLNGSPIAVTVLVLQN